MNENSKSEGEFRYNRNEFPPEKDPVLDLLARLQSAGPQYGVYNLPNRQVAFSHLYIFCVTQDLPYYFLMVHQVVVLYHSINC